MFLETKGTQHCKFVGALLNVHNHLRVNDDGVYEEHKEDNGEKDGVHLEINEGCLLDCVYTWRVNVQVKVLQVEVKPINQFVQAQFASIVPVQGRVLHILSLSPFELSKDG